MKFTSQDHIDLAKYADSLNIEYMCTPFYPNAVSLLESIGVKRYKIASRSVDNLSLLKTIAETKKPVIMSVGGQSDYNIQTALDIQLTL